MTINCFKCGQEIAFNKNILSKTGKQIPLWSDQQNTHGHDDDGNPIRGPLPTQTTTNYNQNNMGVGLQHPRIKPQQQTPETQTGYSPKQYDKPIDRPSLEGILLSQINTAISTLTKKVLEIETRIVNIGEKIEYNTQVDTNKLIGQMQIINDTIAPITKTQIKIGSELYKEQQEREQKERDEKYRKEQEQVKKWNEEKDAAVVTEETGNEDI